MSLRDCSCRRGQHEGRHRLLASTDDAACDGNKASQDPPATCLQPISNVNGAGAGNSPLTLRLRSQTLRRPDQCCLTRHLRS